MGFEWDEESKAGINFRKHGVRMPEAIPVFDDSYAITLADDDPTRTSGGLSRSGWAPRAVCSWLFTRGAPGTFGLSPFVPP